MKQNEATEEYAPNEGTKNPKEEISEVEISNLFEKEFKVLIMNILNELGKGMNEHKEKFN